MVAISFEQQTPYFPDGYSVNSANNGPYGDAIVEEVIPLSRERASADPLAPRTPGRRREHGRMVGARPAAQVSRLLRRRLGAAAGPDRLPPLPAGQHLRGRQRVRPAARPVRHRRSARSAGAVEGQVVWTARQLSRFEEVLGTRGRSGYQLEAWEAIYGPVGADGYPKPLWNKLTGVDRQGRRHVHEGTAATICGSTPSGTGRRWGPKLAGKLHFFAGDMDDFYLNLAVYRFEEFAEGDEESGLRCHVHLRPADQGTFMARLPLGRAGAPHGCPRQPQWEAVNVGRHSPRAQGSSRSTRWWSPCCSAACRWPRSARRHRSSASPRSTWSGSTSSSPTAPTGW